MQNSKPFSLYHTTAFSYSLLFLQPDLVLSYIIHKAINMPFDMQGEICKVSLNMQ